MKSRSRVGRAREHTRTIRRRRKRHSTNADCAPYIEAGGSGSADAGEGFKAGLCGYDPANDSDGSGDSAHSGVFNDSFLAAAIWAQGAPLCHAGKDRF